MEKELDEFPDMWNMGWRVALSIVMGVGWLAFFVIWLAFYAGNYSIYKNIGFFVASLMIVGGVLGAAWASWGMKHARGWSKTAPKGFKWRAVISPIIIFAWAVFLLIWLFSFADSYNPYQNLAIFIVSILAVGGIMGVIWAPWGMRMPRQHW